MTDLFVIGNGFDIAHDIHTEYKKFKRRCVKILIVRCMRMMKNYHLLRKCYQCRSHDIGCVLLRRYLPKIVHCHGNRCVSQKFLQ